MAPEKDYIDSAGLETLWAQVVANFLAKTGGVLNNNALIGWKDSGGTSVANLIQYNTANEFILGYNQRTKGATRIFGKSIVLYTNGETARLTIGDDGVATFASDVVLANTKRIGWVNSGGTTVSNLLQYTSDNKLYLGYGQSTVNDTNIYGKVVNIMTNGNTTRLGIDSSGNTTLSGQLTVSGGVTRFGSTTQCDIYLKRDTIESGTPTNYIHYPTNAQLQFDKYVEGSSTAPAAVMTLGADGNVYCHNAIYEGGTLISTKYTYTEGSYISITSNAISVKEASSSQGGVLTTGTQTIAGVKTLQTSSKATPLIIQNGYTSTSGANHTSIQFKMNDGTSMGYLGIQKNGNIYEPYFYDSSYRTIWHSGNVDIAAITSGIGQAISMAQDNAENLNLHDARIGDLESYFNGDIPKKAVSALSLSGVTINWSFGGVAQTGLTIPDASTSAKGVVTTGAQTFSGTKNFRSSDEEPVILSFSYGGTGYKLGLKFMNSSTDLGAIGMRKYGADEYFYFRPGGTTTYNRVWHAGNANLSTVNWACKDLSASGQVVGYGGVAAYGIADLSLII